MAESLSKSIWNFDPRSIPGCCMWVDPADDSTLTRTGSSVTAIRDKFTNSTTTWTITGTAPTIGAVTLNGSNMLTIPADCRITNNLVVSNAYRTFFMVVQIDNSTIPVTSPRSYSFISGATAGNSFSLLYWHGDGNLYMGRSGLNAMIVPASNLTSGFFNSSFVMATNNAPTVAAGRGIFLNGTALGLSTDTAYTMGLGTVNQQINQAAGNQVSFRLGEMIMFDNPLQEANRQLIEGYLANKWGLAANLPVTHPYRGIRPYARAFQPTDVSGCILWLDADDVRSMTVSGSNISQWNDKSGLANHALQGTGSNQPIVVGGVRNGRSVVRFSGLGVSNTTTTTFFSNTAMAFSNAPYTIFAVAQASNQVSYSAYNYILNGGGTSTFALFVGGRSATFTVFTGNGSTWNDANALSGTQPTSNWTMMTVVNRGTATGLIPYIDGNIRTAKNGATVARTGYIVGEAPSPFRGQNWNGDIAEILVFNRDLSSVDGNLIEGYLAAKWGVTGNLPSIHPYASNRLLPTTPPFQPNQLPSLLAWYDAADPAMIDLSGTGVRTWYDKSGRGWHATPTSNLALYDRTNPSNYFNGNMTVRWDAGGRYQLGGLTLAPSKNCHIFHVGVTQPSTTNSDFFIAPNFRDAVLIMRDNPSYLLWGMGGDAGYGSRDTGITVSNFPMIASVDVSQGATAISTIYVQGDLKGTLSTTGNTLDISRQYFFNGSLFRGRTFEILLFSSNLQTQERQRVEGYLAHKWGITGTLVANHPYKQTRP
jgi:hypothetical protein